MFVDLAPVVGACRVPCFFSRRALRTFAFTVSGAFLSVVLGCHGKSTTVAVAPDTGTVLPVDSGKPLPGQVDVLTQHNDGSRTGQNLGEIVLTTSNVNATTFGKLFSLATDGNMYAQPLIVSNFEIADVTRNVVILATGHNSVFAFDADKGTALWNVSLGPSVPNAAIQDGIGTMNMPVEIGIVATPVIDRDHSLVFVTCKTYVSSVQQIWLHALDLATGKDVAGSPLEVTATAPGNGYDAGGTVTLDAPHHLQRPGLLLANGTVYLAFASHEDWQPYHGWILGYRYDVAAGKLAQVAVFTTTADGTQGGIWQSGQGLISDGTSIYAVTANGSVTAQTDGGTSYGEAFLKLSPSLHVQDWFTPIGYALLNKDDIDLGAGGPILVPGSNPPAILGGGKQGILYLINTMNMGHLVSGSDKNLQEFTATNSIYGAPVLWTGGNGTRLYLWGVGDPLKEYLFKNELIQTNPVATTAPSTATLRAGDTVAGLAVSSNGDNPGTGIVWASKPLSNPDHAIVPGVLYAFDALTLKELWDSQQVPARDNLGNVAKFVAPTVANGKVYVATNSNQVVVYGILDADDGKRHPSPPGR